MEVSLHTQVYIVDKVYKFPYQHFFELVNYYFLVNYSNQICRPCLHRVAYARNSQQVSGVVVIHWLYTLATTTGTENGSMRLEKWQTTRRRRQLRNYPLTGAAPFHRPLDPFTQRQPNGRCWHQLYTSGWVIGIRCQKGRRSSGRQRETVTGHRCQQQLTKSLYAATLSENSCR